MSALSQIIDGQPRAETRGGAAAEPSRVVRSIASALAIVAAAIHVVVAPEHFAEWVGYGVFFVGTAVVEAGLVLALAKRPSPLIVQAGIWSTLATMIMYLVSRTAGIPLGPEAGTVEGIEALGVAATVAEAALMVTLCMLLSGAQLRRTTSALALVSAVLWVAAAGGYLAPSAHPGIAGHGGHGAMAHGSEAKPLPRISDRVRNAPRPPGIG